MRRYEVEVTNRHHQPVREVGRRFAPESTRTVVLNGRQLRVLEHNLALSYEIVEELEPPEPEEDEEETEEVAIEDLTVPELKEQLEEAGLSQSGNKPELVERLTEYLESEEEEDEEGDDEEEESEEEETDDEAEDDDE